MINDRKLYKQQWYQANRERILSKNRKAKSNIPLTDKQLYYKQYYINNRNIILNRSKLFYKQLKTLAANK